MQKIRQLDDEMDRFRFGSGFFLRGKLSNCSFEIIATPAVDWSARRRLLREKLPIGKAEGL
ncbi:hypothetical protein BHE18_02090 [Rossellomorea aquimaris]|uniref:Uncharacterized protein n=1 Tax=Rossellomorea aquimaris TaxID=189382 RepID=A0A1J6WCX7_9BACI|nr:hypothetical protein BHE18_02090 [Rossellomorea aquimaris]